MREIRYAVLDVDGTLLQTQKVFDIVHGLARNYLAERLGIPLEEVRRPFGEYLLEARQRYQVDPVGLISHTSSRLAEHFVGVNKRVWRTFEGILWSTYHEPIGWYPEAVETMYELMARGILIGVSTQAREDWHVRKEEWTGINRFLFNNKTHLVPVWRNKNGSTWLESARYYGFDSDQTLAVGDNLRDDANAALAAGFHTSYWIHRRDEKAWGPIRAGEKEVGVKEISSLSEVLEFAT